MPPTLLALPPEVQAIITSYLVQARDLNRFCLCCKTLKAAILPSLYEIVELKIPLKWNRLASLENLLSSTNGGLRFTRRLTITTQQTSLSNDHYGNLEGLFSTHTGSDDSAFRLYVPGRWASSALNALIRLLIIQIPKNQLTWFLWNHECQLASQTLAVLLERQSDTICTLGFRHYNAAWSESNLAALKMKELTTLRIAGLDPDEDGWPLELLAQNHKTLKRLRLGNEEELAEIYSCEGRIDEASAQQSDDSRSLVRLLRQRFPHLDETSNPLLCPQALSLCGMDVNILGPGISQPIFDYASLRLLIFESCAGLIEAFPVLARMHAEQKDSGALRLHTFKIRHEGISNPFIEALEIFLTSLRPLSRLHVLLEGGPGKAILNNVLKVHGKSLISLIWEERLHPRKTISHDPYHKAEGYGNLKSIARHCTKLRALGIPLAWHDLAASDTNHDKVSSFFAKLRHLRTLHIRNLPAATTTSSWLPNDYMIQGLASMLLDVVRLKAPVDRPSALKAIAIGAPTYGSVMMGVNHYPMDSFANFLQLRIFHLDYSCGRHESQPPRIHLIAKGAPADSLGYVNEQDLFTIYWLDAHPQKMRILDDE